MIKLEDVSFSYEKEILSHISLSIRNKRATCIIGLNGSGKSTLANLISGLLSPTSGKIFIDSLEINKKTDSKEIRKKIGMVFQNPSNQILFSTVEDDLIFTLENMKFPKEDIPKRISSSLSKVHMNGFEKANPYQLSGGEKQRIAIASQLSLHPNYIVLDEATSMLDSYGKEDIYKLIESLKKEIGVIYITNQLDEMVYADDIIIIDQGHAYSYTLSKIMNEPSILEKHHLKVPFLLRLSNSLSLKKVEDLRENKIIERISSL